MTLRAAVISIDAARAHVRRALGVPTLSAEVDLRPEILRAVIWSLTQGEAPAHVLRILNRATAFALGTAERTPDAGEIRQELRDALDELARIIHGGRLPVETRTTGCRTSAVVSARPGSLVSWARVSASGASKSDGGGANDNDEEIATDRVGRSS